MEAPDKIFLAFDHGFVAQSSNVKEDINGNSVFLPQYIPIEYIRKDALLEWARERLDFACALKSEGQKTVCRELIDKIETL